MQDISFYQPFEIRKQSWVTSKVAEDDHNQLFRIFVVNHYTRVGIGIKLKFSWIMHKERIALVPLIRLGAFVDMVSPEDFNGFRFYDPVISGRVGGFQLFNIDLLDLGKK